MDEKILREVNAVGLQNAIAAGMSQKAIGNHVGWSSQMVGKVLKDPSEGSFEKHKKLYRLLLRHRFIVDSDADIANELYALGDFFVDSNSDKEKFLELGKLFERYFPKCAAVGSLEEKAGKGDVE